MVLRKCQQCKAVTDDKYGFCLKCGFEFPKIDENHVVCIKCGFENPKDAEFCVKCGIPLIINQEFQNKNQPPFITYKKVSAPEKENLNYKRTSRMIIAFGYIFSILGGLIGFIIALYLVTRKDPVARKHGKIQLGILIFYLIIIGIALGTGTVTLNEITNITSMQNLTKINY